MRVCYFGIYKPAYTRTVSNLAALKEAGIPVVECATRQTSWHKYHYLWRTASQLRSQYDALLVGFPGQTILPLAWLIAKLYRKRLLFDAFFSMHEAIILDRQERKPGSLTALKFWFLDWLSCRLADTIFLQTNEQIGYYIKTFRAAKRKFVRLPLGVDEAVMYPRERRIENKKFLVHFHGTHLPTQGIPTIVQAAALLKGEEIVFNMIGKLSTYQETIAQAKAAGADNIRFIDFLPYDQLAEHMAQADVCLGVFGDTDRAKRDFAFKIVEALAMGRPLITADEPSTREFLVDRQDCLLCRTADSQDLANKILGLRDDPALRLTIAAAGRQSYERQFTSVAIGKTFLNLREG